MTNILLFIGIALTLLSISSIVVYFTVQILGILIVPELPSLYDLKPWGQKDNKEDDDKETEKKFNQFVDSVLKKRK